MDSPMLAPDQIAAALAVGILTIPVLMIVILVRQRSQKRKLSASISDLTSKLAAETEKRFTAEKRAVTMATRFSTVVDADAEAARVMGEANAKLEKAESEVESLTTSIERLRTSYQEKKVIYDGLLSQIAVFDDRLAFGEMGVYQPHFDFTDSDTFKVAIEDVREQQKAMITAKNAVVCRTEWTVEGSKAKGKTMTDRNIRLTLRAFNNECDAAIANVRWNNANAVEKRVIAARDQIDKANQSNTIEITNAYLQLKLRELFLTHEYREKLKAEKEERAELARAAREEQKLLRDVEDAEREETKYQKLLSKAREEAVRATGAKLETYAQQIAMLERDLAEAHARAERAQAMAEMTRSGYVYVISNIGSFGPNMVKIGLTRRLDPDDRIRELGDASVPFTFDTHAMIYSDNAPTLERALHAEFEPFRVNVTNYRKEFFRVSPDTVEGAVRRLAPEALYFPDVEAQEYHESLAKRSAVLAAMQSKETAFPDTI
jgi:hypothetical protein